MGSLVDVEPTLAQIATDLAESEADVVSERVVALEPVLDRMRASIGRMIARRLAKVQVNDGHAGP